MVSLVCATGTMLLSCGHRLGPVQATQSAGWVGHPNLPDIFVEKAKDCIAQDAWQMDPGHVVLNATLEVNEDRDKVGVTIDGIPERASDFGACIRNVLRDMPIAEEPFQQGVASLKYLRKHAGDGQDALEHFIKAIAGVPIVESELVLETEGYVVVLPVTVKVVAKPETFIDGNQRILTKLGQLALDNVGYDEIMRRAEEQGWVKTVRIKHAQSRVGKGLIAQEAAVAAEGELVKLFTKYALAAGMSAAADSPVPGPGDAVAVGILVVGLFHVGALAMQEIVAAQQAEAQRCREVKEKCIDHCSGPAGLPAPGGGRFRLCMRECMKSHGCSF